MSDTELANQFARFRPLLNRYRRKYYFVDYDKEDIEQEAWIAFVESYRTYNYELNITFASYYNKVLRNHLNSVLRYQNAYKRTSNIDKVSWDLIEEETSDYDVRFVNQQTPVDEVISKELVKTLLLSLSQLESLEQSLGRTSEYSDHKHGNNRKMTSFVDRMDALGKQFSKDELKENNNLNPNGKSNQKPIAPKPVPRSRNSSLGGRGKKPSVRGSRGRRR